MRQQVLVGNFSIAGGGFSDPDSPPAIRYNQAVTRLHDLGVEHVVMLTADNAGTVRAIAERVGVDDYRAELLSDEKVDAVAMVGDGINDAPALAAADVDVAMGPPALTPRSRPPISC